ncbi:MAG: hypothetical protein ACOC9C_00370 [Chloroflexota bacterium]
MDYLVKRLPPKAAGSPIYQLLEPGGAELMRAEQSTSAEPGQRRQLRLVRPDDRIVATMDLSQGTTENANGESDADYAIIHDYAVYAIFGVRRRSCLDEPSEKVTYFTLEVEGDTWLVLPHPESANCYAIYDEVPVGLNTYDSLTDVDLPAPSGSICRVSNDHTFEVDLSRYRLQHTKLIALGLVFLIDSMPPNV